jgi:hypothetical protein
MLIDLAVDGLRRLRRHTLAGLESLWAVLPEKRELDAILNTKLPNRGLRAWEKCPGLTMAPSLPHLETTLAEAVKEKHGSRVSERIKMAMKMRTNGNPHREIADKESTGCTRCPRNCCRLMWLEYHSG